MDLNALNSGQFVCRTVCVAVDSVEVVNGDWLMGLLSRAPIPQSPWAKWIDTKTAVYGLIKRGELPAATAPFFLPMVNPVGFFRNVAADVLAEFVSVQSEDAARVFVRKHGVFAWDNLDVKDKPAKIKKRWKELEKTGIPFALSLGAFFREQQEIESGQHLWAAIQSNNEAEAARLCAEVGPTILVDFAKQNISSPIETGRYLLTAQINRGLQSARFGPVEVDGFIVPGITTTFTLDAVYVRAMSMMLRGDVLKKCKRCSASFVQRKVTQEFCGDSCQQLAKRYRQLERQREAKGTAIN
jgi:hypothetical protein